MQAITLTITPLSAFGTPLLGDTLFGQLCWAIRNRYSEQRLNALLQDYTQQKPFLVVSDAFPAAYLPKPTLPARFFAKIEADQRKKAKKQIWMPIATTHKAVKDWQGDCLSDKQISPDKEKNLQQKRVQPHNSINRVTGTTGDDGFAPYGMLQTWYQPNIQLHCHFIIDTNRFSQDELIECLTDIGNFGYGRDATIGLGKFRIEKDRVTTKWNTHPQANALMTLAPSTPQGLSYDKEKSFYQPFSRFGRHGDMAVHQQGKPFKNPILMAAAGAVFTTDAQLFIGQGLGADKQKLSITMPETVQQGYAPVVSVFIEDA